METVLYSPERLSKSKKPVYWNYQTFDKSQKRLDDSRMSHSNKRNISRQKFFGGSDFYLQPKVKISAEVYDVKDLKDLFRKESNVFHTNSKNNILTKNDDFNLINESSISIISYGNNKDTNIYNTYHNFNLNYSDDSIFYATNTHKNEIMDYDVVSIYKNKSEISSLDDKDINFTLAKKNSEMKGKYSSANLNKLLKQNHSNSLANFLLDDLESHRTIIKDKKKESNPPQAYGTNNEMINNNNYSHKKAETYAIGFIPSTNPINYTNGINSYFNPKTKLNSINNNIFNDVKIIDNINQKVEIYDVTNYFTNNNMMLKQNNDTNELNFSPYIQYMNQKNEMSKNIKKQENLLQEIKELSREEKSLIQSVNFVIKGSQNVDINNKKNVFTDNTENALRSKSTKNYEVEIIKNILNTNINDNNIKNKNNFDNKIPSTNNLVYDYENFNGYPREKITQNELINNVQSEIDKIYDDYIKMNSHLFNELKKETSLQISNPEAERNIPINKYLPIIVSAPKKLGNEIPIKLEQAKNYLKTNLIYTDSNNLNQKNNINCNNNNELTKQDSQGQVMFYNFTDEKVLNVQTRYNYKNDLATKTIEHYNFTEQRNENITLSKDINCRKISELSNPLNKGMINDVEIRKSYNDLKYELFDNRSAVSHMVVSNNFLQPSQVTEFYKPLLTNPSEVTNTANLIKSNVVTLYNYNNSDQGQNNNVNIPQKPENMNRNYFNPAPYSNHIPNENKSPMLSNSSHNPNLVTNFNLEDKESKIINYLNSNAISSEKIIYDENKLFTTIERNDSLNQRIKYVEVNYNLKSEVSKTLEKDALHVDNLWKNPAFSPNIQPVGKLHEYNNTPNSFSNNFNNMVSPNLVNMNNNNTNNFLIYSENINNFDLNNNLKGQVDSSKSTTNLFLRSKTMSNNFNQLSNEILFEKVNYIHQEQVNTNPFLTGREEKRPAYNNPQNFYIDSLPKTSEKTTLPNPPINHQKPPIYVNKSSNIPIQKKFEPKHNNGFSQLKQYKKLSNNLETNSVNSENYPSKDSNFNNTINNNNKSNSNCVISHIIHYNYKNKNLVPSENISINSSNYLANANNHLNNPAYMNFTNNSYQKDLKNYIHSYENKELEQVKNDFKNYELKYYQNTRYSNDPNNYPKTNNQYITPIKESQVNSKFINAETKIDKNSSNLINTNNININSFSKIKPQEIQKSSDLSANRYVNHGYTNNKNPNNIKDNFSSSHYPELFNTEIITNVLNINNNHYFAPNYSNYDDQNKNIQNNYNIDNSDFTNFYEKKQETINNIDNKYNNITPHNLQKLQDNNHVGNLNNYNPTYSNNQMNNNVINALNQPYSITIDSTASTSLNNNNLNRDIRPKTSYITSYKNYDNTGNYNPKDITKSEIIEINNINNQNNNNVTTNIPSTRNFTAYDKPEANSYYQQTSSSEVTYPNIELNNNFNNMNSNYFPHTPRTINIQNYIVIRPEIKNYEFPIKVENNYNMNNNLNQLNNNNQPNRQTYTYSNNPMYPNSQQTKNYNNYQITNNFTPNQNYNNDLIGNNINDFVKNIPTQITDQSHKLRDKKDSADVQFNHNNNYPESFPYKINYTNLHQQNDNGSQKLHVLNNDKFVSDFTYKQNNLDKKASYSNLVLDKNLGSLQNKKKEYISLNKRVNNLQPN